MKKLFDLSTEAEHWVETTFDRLTLEAKLGQLMHPMLFGQEKRKEEVWESMAAYQVGGGFVGSGSYREMREWVAGLQKMSAVPPLFSSDFECGARLVQEGVRFGAAMSLAAIADLGEAIRCAYEAGRITAIQGGAVGVRWSFAPVADLNFHPDNPITNIRSFGDDPERVAALASAYLRGMQDHGMAAAVKHFPGDGVDSRDQHVATTVNTLPLAEWERSYGRTFGAVIAAGTYTIMMGHIALAGVSSRDKHGRYLPATLDPAIQIHLLREHLGFQGLIVSDAMRMTGVRARGRTEAETIVQNVVSGSDVVLMPTDVGTTLQALRKAVEAGTLPITRVDAAVWRILSLKAKLELFKPAVALPSAEQAEQEFSTRVHDSLAREIAEQSITLERDRDGDYPLSLAPGDKVVLCQLPRDLSEGGLVVATEINHHKAECTPLEDALVSRGYHVQIVTTLTELLAQAVDASAVVYVSRTVCQAGRGSIRMTKAAHGLIDWDLITSDLPVFFVSFGTPYVGWELPDLPNFACGYLATPMIEETYARLLLGELPFRGRLPVQMPAN